MVLCKGNKDGKDKLAITIQMSDNSRMSESQLLQLFHGNFLSKSKSFSEGMFLHRGFSILQSEHPLF